MSQIKKHNFSTNMPFQENKEKKYALVVGVNAALHIPSMTPLRYAESDAQGLGWLLAREECNFVLPSAVLTGAEASTYAVRQAVIHLLEQRSQDDLLLFYFIGHSYASLTSDGQTEVYLVTSDFDPEIAEQDPSAYLSLSWLRRMFLEQNTTASTILILDCSLTGNIWDIANPQPAEQSKRSWAVLASTEANMDAYEVINGRGEGHTYMTGLILDALNGKELTALDHNGDMTLLSLHSYVQKRMAKQDSDRQRPTLYGSFRRPWILAHHPTQNPVKTNAQEVVDASFVIQRPFDEAICPTATFADLDIEQIKVFLSQERVLLQDDYLASSNEREQMEALGLLQGEYPSYAALLCFGRRPSQWLTGAYTRCIYWKDSKRLNGWIDDREYRGSLLQQFTQALSFLHKHLNFGRNIERGGSYEQPEIPFRVLEEALANALVHREYVTGLENMPSAEGVIVEIFHDRIEISNPGKPLVSVEALQNVSEQYLGSHPRNPQILRIFYLANHIEKIGTGLARIQKWLQEAELPPALFKPNLQTQTFTITISRPPILVQGTLPKENSTPTPMLPIVYVPTLPSKSTFRLRSVNHIFSLLFIPLLLIAIITGSVIGMNLSHNTGNPPTPTLLPTASTTIEIASDFPTSGTDTVTEAPLQNGVQMAIDEANGNFLLSGYTLKLVPYDDVGRGSRPDPLVGASNIQKAISDNLIAGIIGPGNSTVAQMELPLANQAPIALISPNTTYPCLTKSTINDPTNCSGTNDILAQVRPTAQLTYFRLATTDDLQGKEAADYFYTTLHYHKVLILNDYSDLYSSGLANAFQHEWSSLGGQALTQALPENYSSVQDYQNVLQNAAPDQPDLIYFAGDDPNGTYVLQALANISALQNVALAGGDGIVDNDFLLAAAQIHPHAPVYASLPIQDPAHSGTNVGSDFMQNYISSGYQNYRAYAASAYDCTMMLIQAIKMALQKVSTPHGSQDVAGAKQFRLAILQALAHLPYTGATGTHSFDTNGDTTNHTISFYQLDLSKPQATWDWKTQVNAS